MKNFPSLLAVIGAWFCAFGLVPVGVLFFVFSSLWAIIVQEDTSTYTLMFLCANLVASVKLFA